MVRLGFWLFVVLPLGVVFVTLAVANRQEVALVLDPFRPSNPALSIPGPMYAFLFGALFIGLLLGGIASWIGQGKWRALARERTREAYRWKSEADRLLREQDVVGLPSPSQGS